MRRPMKKYYMRNITQMNYNEQLNAYYEELEKYVDYLEKIVTGIKTK